MINTAYRSHSLDKGQRAIVEEMRGHVQALQTAAENRYDERLRLRVSESLAQQVADTSRSLILELAELLEEAAENIPRMSTYSGLVHPLAADEYVDQELLRLETYDGLESWKSRHANHQEHVYDQTRNDSILMRKRTEEVVLEHSKSAFKQPISNLDAQEDCRRSTLALKEVMNRKRGIKARIFSAITDTPVQIACALSAGGAMFGNYLVALTAAGGSACVQSGGVYLWHRKGMAQLRRVDSDIRNRLFLHHVKQPECVQENFFEAGITQDPKKVLGITS